MRRRSLALVGSQVMLCLIGSGASAQVPGLRALGPVIVETAFELPDNMKSIDTGSFRVSVELELRKAGVRIVARSSSGPPPALVWVSGNVLPVTVDNGRPAGVAYTVMLEVRRTVLFVGEAPGKQFYADVWDNGASIGVAPGGAVDAENAMRPSVEKKARELANEILAANPRAP